MQSNDCSGLIAEPFEQQDLPPDPSDTSSSRDRVDRLGPVDRLEAISGQALAKRDYYEVLEVPRDADDAALKKAYRQLALQYHPDRNSDDPTAEERFKEVSEAYAVLSNVEKRSAYDRFGHAGVAGPGATGGGPDFGDLGGFADVFNDLFGDIFGAGRSGRRRGRGQRGADLRYHLEIEFLDVVVGVESTIQIPKMRTCQTCSGSGARPGTQPEICSRCGGAGQIMFQQGFFRVNRPCDVCGGSGEQILDRCRGCRGSGRIEGKQTITVRVPAGVENGTRLRMAGEGEAGIAGGPAGELYVDIMVKPHPLFERDGTDIHCEVPIQFVQAVLGAEIEVPTLEGKVSLRIPEGTQSGKLFRMRAKGLPPLQPRLDAAQLERMRGDLFVRIFVEVPTKLNERQRKLLDQFAEESDTLVSSPATRGFMDKLRDFFE